MILFRRLLVGGIKVAVLPVAMAAALIIVLIAAAIVHPSQLPACIGVTIGGTLK